MRNLNKLYVKVVVALVIGFLLAGASGRIVYDCPLIDGAAGCASIEKALMHPGDLLSNKQGSLTDFAETFVESSIVTFALLSAVSYMQTKKKAKQE